MGATPMVLSQQINSGDGGSILKMLNLKVHQIVLEIIYNAKDLIV